MPDPIIQYLTRVTCSTCGAELYSNTANAKEEYLAEAQKAALTAERHVCGTAPKK